MPVYEISGMNDEIETNLGQNGRVVIPVAFREALGIDVGDPILLRVQEGEVRITTRRMRIERAQSRASRYLAKGESLVDDLLEERKREVEREAR
jgi:bifunctional DNA-binding transcriptional regulator/antitoxin component of YhaV-PrlF toxin-antitoxin module